MNKFPSNRFVTFIGTTPHIGSTAAAFFTAALLARDHKLNVGYFCLNLKSSKLHRYLGQDEPQFTLDSLRAEMKSGTLTAEALQRYCYKPYPNISLSILFGNLQRELAETYLPKHIELLLTKASSSFDLCILDVNAYWDNAATLVALHNMSIGVLVTNDLLSSFQEDYKQWTEMGLHLYTIPREKLKLYIYKTPGRGDFSLREIEKETGLSVIGTSKYHREIARGMEEGKASELLHKPYIYRNYDSLAHGIAARFGLNLGEDLDSLLSPAPFYKRWAASTFLWRKRRRA